jgi:acetyltransferase-like isoleucine patch superfamily enzyme
MIQTFLRYINRLYAIRKNVTCGANVHVGIGTIVWAPRRLEIGDNVYIGKFCTVQVSGRIGRGVLIGNNVGLVGRLDHRYRQSGVPVRNAEWVGDSPELAADKRNWLEIEDDVWIGFGATILGGVTVRRGSIIAAGSVVREDTSEYDIVSGNPATRIGRRFATPEEIAAHEAGIAAFYARGSRR